MPRFIREIWLPAELEEVWRKHSSAQALVELSPPINKLELLQTDAPVVEGATHQFRLRILGIPLQWVAEISDVRPPHQFRDTATRSIFASWTHLHEFLPERGGTRARDTVDYVPPLGALGKFADWLFIRRMLNSMWRHRHRVLEEWFMKET